MAAPNVGDVVATTLVNQRGELANNVEDNNAILSEFKRRGRIRTADGGTKIAEPIDYTDNTNAQSYDGYDTLATGAQAVLDYAEFAWKQYAVTVPVSGREEAMNSGREKVIDLARAKVTNAKRSLNNKVALGLYSDGTGNGGKDITGLEAAVPTTPTTGTYGGWNRANFPVWRPQVQDPAVTPTAATIQGVMNALWISCCRGTDKPKLILSDNILYGLYWASLQPQQRFTDPARANLGFTELAYAGAPVIMDGGIGGNAPASTMFFLNTDYLHWRPHVDRNFVPMDPDARAPVNQDAKIYGILFMGNLTCSGQMFQGRLIGT